MQRNRGKQQNGKENQKYQGNTSCKIKNQNGMDVTEAQDIKKRWQEYTEKLYEKDHNDPDNHNGVITHLELDILESKVKWALGSITTQEFTMNKASGGDGIPPELFQILKDDAIKVLHSMCQHIWKFVSGHEFEPTLRQWRTGEPGVLQHGVSEC